MVDLDPIIHAPARLRIMTALIEALDERDEISFPVLQKQLEMTGGNLTTHLGKLEEAQYITTRKTFKGKKPVTYIRITGKGREAFRNYRNQLITLLGKAP